MSVCICKSVCYLVMVDVVWAQAQQLSCQANVVNFFTKPVFQAGNDARKVVIGKFQITTSVLAKNLNIF